MALDYQPVTPGQTLTVSADEWNALKSQLAQARTAGPDRNSNRKPTIQPAGDLVVVRNDTKADILRNRVIVLDVPLTVPTSANKGDGMGNDNGATDEYLKGVFLSGILPVLGYRGYWGVTVDSIPMGQFGRVMVVGTIAVRINVVDTTDRYVECGSSTTIAQSAASGIGQIIWVAGGVGRATQTGEQWATIRIGGAQSAFPPAPDYMAWTCIAGKWQPSWPRFH
ncbi:MAG: hypothetical protein ACRYGG_07380 [Janthinobacterium lividum]